MQIRQGCPFLWDWVSSLASRVPLCDAQPLQLYMAALFRPVFAQATIGFWGQAERKCKYRYRVKDKDTT